MVIPSSASEKRSILVVDDEPGMRALFTFMLGAKGYAVETAADGEEAIESVQSRSFDLVFLDIRMPYMDGVQVFRELRKHRPQIAVIMMTGYAVEAQLEQALHEGAKGFIRKPFTVDELLGSIHKVFGQGPL